LIVDPYLGSGSCGIAAAELGYNFLGIEIEPQYGEMASRRIAAAFMQPPLSAASKNTHPALLRLSRTTMQRREKHERNP
jgi:DNA modification methylase